ncbi:MAG: Xaa-Pro peptidase family protein [Planctomycetota bacterium]
MSQTATVFFGVPSDNMALFHQIRFAAHDPAALIVRSDGKREVILRDVELEVAAAVANADEVRPYEAYTPNAGLSADRPTRAVQSTVECLSRLGVTAVTGDRSLPLLLIDQLTRAGISVELDPLLGIRDRRSKDAEEIAALREATRVTEDVMRFACELIAGADAAADGSLGDPTRSGETLTSERVRGLIIARLAENGALTDGPIVAGGPVSAICHHHGEGVLRTGEPIIVDIFPRHLATGYHGDCTRCVVHGDVPDEVARMHATIVSAKAAGIGEVRAGSSGDAVHAAVVREIEHGGYRMGFPEGEVPMHGPPTGFCSMPHGTGHGLGLELKEPPLLDIGGPELVAGDAITVEPGLYAPGLGGLRLEDLVIVTAGGSENLNTLHEGLDWA